MRNAYDIIHEIKKVVKGKDGLIETVWMAILAQGHVLLEDIPGVGKTTVALAFRRVFQLDYQRISFTPDTMASDVIGFTMYNKELGQFQYKSGAIMANMVLADEINRTSSKTQSALLEAMEEGKVTVDGVTYELPKPFVVISTQNPYGSAGTQMLPLSQLDRFIVRLSMGYPDKESEMDILREHQNEQKMDVIQTIGTKEELLRMQEEVKQVYTSDLVLEYMTDLLHQTRHHPYIACGVSPRGGLAMCRLAKARAFLNQRDYVTPEDVMDVFVDVCGHRIIPSVRAKTEGKDVKELLQKILKETRIPKLG